MAKRTKQPKEVPVQRAERAKLTAAESLKRLEELSKRKEQFIPSVRVDRRTQGAPRGVKP